MKTANILLILLVSSLLASSFPQRAFCFSSGYERYTTDLFEVYTEYLQNEVAKSPAKSPFFLVLERISISGFSVTVKQGDLSGK